MANNQSSNVGTDRAIFVAFNQEMNASTINNNTFTIAGVAGSVSYDSVQRIAYFHPAAPFAASTQYAVSLSAGVQSAKGLALIPHTFSFLTRDTPDLSPPVPVPVPVAGGCIGTNGSFSVRFDEPIDTTTLTSSTFFIVGVSATISYDALTQTATLTPLAPLAPNTTYTVVVTAAVKDLGGVGLGQDYQFQFDTCAGEQPPSFCTFTKGGFAGPGAPGQLLDTYYTTLFSTGLTIGINDGAGSQHSIVWTGDATGLAALKAYLTSPAGGASSALLTDQVNATATTSGELSEQVATLTLNIALSGYSGGSTGFGNLVLTGTGTSLDGLTVESILAIANNALAGNGLPSGYTFSTLNDLITNLNESFDNCGESDWAKAHLVIAAS